MPTTTTTNPAGTRLHFRYQVPRAGRLPLIDVPTFWRAVVAERRAVLCHMVPHLKRAGFSQNQIAREFDVPASALCVWVKQYERGGIEALLPRPMGRHPSRTPKKFILGLLPS